MKHLQTLGGNHNVVRLIEGLRYQDQITLVLDYFEHKSFKDYLGYLTVEQIRVYLIRLFSALAHVHSNNIIHRDIKPSNFLFSPETGRSMLVDFGLAQLVDVNTNKFPSHLSDLSANERAAILAKCINNHFRCKSLLQSRRLFGRPVAPRAGTRGFRAPEVLLRVPKQDTALDIWSVGVIMLSLFTGRYPFFVSKDDMSALVEIAAVTGSHELCEVGLEFGKQVTFSSVISKPDLAELCRKLNCTPRTSIPDEAYDLLKKCLSVRPYERPSAQQALDQPFLKS